MWYQLNVIYTDIPLTIDIIVKYQAVRPEKWQKKSCHTFSTCLVQYIMFSLNIYRNNI